MRFAFSIFKFFSLLCFTAAIAVSSDGAANADSMYVSNKGNDGRSRKQAQNRSTPWRTIQRAVNALNPGDTIVVLAGTYYESVRVRRSGTPNRYLQLRSERRHGARLIGSIDADKLSYLTIDGFDVTNPSSTGLTKGISSTRTHHVTVRNCRVRDCWGGGISFDQSDWILCEWNLVHGNAFFDPNQHSGISVYQPQYRGNDSRRFGVIIRNNTSFNNRNLVDNVNFGRPTDGNGIVLDDYYNQQSSGNGVRYNRQTMVENNLCFANGGQGIHCYLSQNIRIRNNTCTNNLGSFDFGGEVTVSESERVYLYNNVLVPSTDRFAAFQFNSSNVFFYYNLFDGPTRDLRFNGSNINGDARLIPGGFGLSRSSPGRNRGINFYDHFRLDVQGQSRYQGVIDMGAIESN